MRAFFHPFLPNGLTGDPLLLVELLDCGRSLLLDLGDVHGVAARKLLRVDRVAVTHTHMDHFVGFDALLRLMLGRNKELVLSGPTGLLRNVQGKLDGYVWNLIEDYSVRLRVEEIDGDTVHSALFSAAGGLRPVPQPARDWTGVLHAEDSFSLHAVTLDHGIPVLAFALREVERLAVNRDRLLGMGLRAGPWLNELKQAVRSHAPQGEPLAVPRLDGTAGRFARGDLVRELLFRAPGQELAYVSDVRYSESNIERAAALARGVGLLVCETAFLHCDEQLARERNHLTARQAGELAREAGAKRLAPFHISPRYEGREEALLEEAARHFDGPVVRLPAGPPVV